MAGSNQSRGQRHAATLLACSAIVLAIPATASADTVVSYSVDPEDGPSLYASARGHDQNDIRMSFERKREAFVLTDSEPVDLRDAAGDCGRLGQRSVRCRPPSTLVDIDIFLGRGADRLTVDRSVPIGITGFGGEGDDRLLGGPASYDEMLGGEGTDVVHGGAGGDAVRGDEGKGDRVYGDAGNDTVDVGDNGPKPGRDSGDYAFGGPGEDSLLAVGEREAILDCGSGLSDSVTLYDTNRSKIRSCEEINRYPPFGF